MSLNTKNPYRKDGTEPALFMREASNFEDRYGKELRDQSHPAIAAGLTQFEGHVAAYVNCLSALKQWLHCVFSTPMNETMIQIDQEHPFSWRGDVFADLLYYVQNSSNDNVGSKNSSELRSQLVVLCVRRLLSALYDSPYKYVSVNELVKIVQPAGSIADLHSDLVDALDQCGGPGAKRLASLGVEAPTSDFDSNQGDPLDEAVSVASLPFRYPLESQSLYQVLDKTLVGGQQGEPVLSLLVEPSETLVMSREANDTSTSTALLSVPLEMHIDRYLWAHRVTIDKLRREQQKLKQKRSNVISRIGKDASHSLRLLEGVAAYCKYDTEDETHAELDSAHVSRLAEMQSLSKNFAQRLSDEKVSLKRHLDALNQNIDSCFDVLGGSPYNLRAFIYEDLVDLEMHAVVKRASTWYLVDSSGVQHMDIQDILSNINGLRCFDMLFYEKIAVPEGEQNEAAYDGITHGDESSVNAPLVKETEEVPETRLRGGNANDESSDDGSDFEDDQSDAEAHSDADVELGFVDEMPSDWDVVDALGKAGGQPVWLDPTHPLSLLDVQCTRCNTAMPLLIMVNSPDDHHDYSAARALYVFYCRQASCQENGPSARVWRQQISRHNLFFAKTDQAAKARSEAEKKLDPDTGLLAGPSEKQIPWPEFDLVSGFIDEDSESDDAQGSDGNPISETVRDMGAQEARELGKLFSREKLRERGIDETFVRFQRTLAKEPEQVLRFYRAPGVDQAEPLWTSSRKLGELIVPSYGEFGRTLEFQVMPTLLSFFKEHEVSFDSLLVYSTTGVDEGWVEEIVVPLSFEQEGLL